MKPLKSLKNSRFSFFLGLLCIPFFCLAQKDSSNKKLSLGVHVSPEYSFQTVGPQENTEIKFKSKGQTGYSAGISAKYKLNKNISLIGGIGYGFKHCSLLKTGLRFAEDYDPISKKYLNSTIETNFRLNEIQVPLMLQFYNRNNKYYFSIGAEFVYLFKNSTERTIYFSNGKTDRLSSSVNETMFNLGPVLGFGFILFQQKKTQLTIEPLLKLFVKNYGVLGYSEEGPLVNFGLKTSFWF